MHHHIHISYSLCSSSGALTIPHLHTYYSTRIPLKRLFHVKKQIIYVHFTSYLDSISAQQRPTNYVLKQCLAVPFPKHVYQFRCDIIFLRQRSSQKACRLSTVCRYSSCMYAIFWDSELT